MSEQQLTEAVQSTSLSTSSVLLGTGLALASFIILPAVATRIGLGSSLTGALRIALREPLQKLAQVKMKMLMPVRLVLAVTEKGEIYNHINLSIFPHLWQHQVYIPDSN